jgi:hypothetical protein
MKPKLSGIIAIINVAELYLHMRDGSLRGHPILHVGVVGKRK